MFGELRLRSVVSIISLIVVSLFLVLYLCFQYFWVYEKRVTEVTALQSEETERVLSILDIKGSEMTASLSDYAAWNEMIDFIQHPSDEFKNESMNVHALISNRLDSFFMFSPDFQLRWALRFDYTADQVTEYESLLPTIELFLHALDKKIQKQEVEAVYRYVVIHNMPYLLAFSRVCQSDGLNCQFGYMVFVKKLNYQFVEAIHKTTGLNIEVSTINKDDVNHLPQIQNVSYLTKECKFTGTVLFKVHHNVQLPSFLNWDDILALGIFVIVMFSINLLMVSQVIRPVVDANNVLKAFKKSGNLLSSDSFFLVK